MDVGGMAKRKKRGWRGHVVLWRGVSMCLKAQTGRVIAVWQDNNRMNNAFFLACASADGWWTDAGSELT